MCTWHSFNSKELLIDFLARHYAKEKIIFVFIFIESQFFVSRFIEENYIFICEDTLKQFLGTNS